MVLAVLMAQLGNVSFFQAKHLPSCWAWRNERDTWYSTFTGDLDDCIKSYQDSYNDVSIAREEVEVSFLHLSLNYCRESRS